MDTEAVSQADDSSSVDQGDDREMLGMIEVGKSEAERWGYEDRV